MKIGRFFAALIVLQTGCSSVSTEPEAESALAAKAVDYSIETDRMVYEISGREPILVRFSYRNFGDDTYYLGDCVGGIRSLPGVLEKQVGNDWNVVSYYTCTESLQKPIPIVAINPGEEKLTEMPLIPNLNQGEYITWGWPSGEDLPGTYRIRKTIFLRWSEKDYLEYVANGKKSLPTISIYSNVFEIR